MKVEVRVRYLDDENHSTCQSGIAIKNVDIDNPLARILALSDAFCALLKHETQKTQSFVDVLGFKDDLNYNSKANQERPGIVLLAEDIEQ